MENWRESVSLTVSSATLLQTCKQEMYQEPVLCFLNVQLRSQSKLQTDRSMLREETVSRPNPSTVRHLGCRTDPRSPAGEKASRSPSRSARGAGAWGDHRITGRHRRRGLRLPPLFHGGCSHRGRRKTIGSGGGAATCGGARSDGRCRGAVRYALGW